MLDWYMQIEYILSVSVQEHEFALGLSKPKRTVIQLSPQEEGERAYRFGFVIIFP